MGFFLLSRGHDAGELRLFSDTVYETRQEALSALADLTSDPDFEHADDEVFVVDLDAATPVLLVPAPSPRAPQTPEPEPFEPEVAVEESVAAASPEPVDPAIAAAVIAEVAIAEAQPSPGEKPDSSEPVPLSHALKAAAGVLESEGIAAPERVETPADPPAAREWPWNSSGETFIPTEIEEPSIDQDDLVVAAETEGLDRLDRTVVMGSYGDEDDPAPASPAAEAGFDDIPVAASAPAQPEPPVREPLSASTGDEPEDDADDISGMLADLEPIEDVPPPPISIVPDPKPLETDAPSEPEAIAEVALITETAEITAPADEESAGAAEDGSSEDAGALGCTDCVYVATCPNQEDLTPGNCGSFQWKAV